MIARTPLDAWIARQTHGGDQLDPEQLRAYQLRALNETIVWAVKHSPFYREHLGSLDNLCLNSLDDLAQLPVMDDHDLKADSQRMVCVSQGEVERVVTLRTSGSTAEPKRIFFMTEDLEHTRDFFTVGMSQMIGPGAKAILFMPGATPYSVGDLLQSALAGHNAQCISYGFLDNPAHAATMVTDSNARVLVGIPGQLLTLAREHEQTLRPQIDAVLLSGEHAPLWLTRDIATRLDCEVFVHYGLTETGLGGGVECRAHNGLHLREADLLVEIVDPETKDPLPEGEAGEIALTTLRRRGMPLIRYATGDLGMLLGRNCPCGSRVQRLLPLGERIKESAALHAMQLSLRHVDEAIFKVEGVSACHAVLHLAASPGHSDVLDLTLSAVDGVSKNLDTLEAQIHAFLLASPDFGPLIQAGNLDVTIQWAPAWQCLAMTGPKRILKVHNLSESNTCPS